MCLATPGRIVEISGDDDRYRVARVDFGGVVRTAQLVYVPDARLGDYVIVQAGFAVRTLSEREAEESLRLARELAAAAATELKAAPSNPPAPTAASSA